MSGQTHQSAIGGVLAGVKGVICGADDTRLRALWRVLIAVVFVVQITEVAAVTIASVLGLGGRVFLGLAQAAIFAILLVGWAAYVDRRPLADYGFSLSGTWVADAVVGFLAVLVGFGLWLGAGSVLGWAEVEVAASAPEGAVLIGLGAFLFGAVLNVWVQETIFVGIVGKNAAEGLASRGLTPSRAVLGAWAVAVLLFTLLHQPSTPGRIANLLIVLGVYALLYAQTGELALPIGVHAGVNYAGGVLVVAPSIAAQRPSLFEVTNSLSGVLGSLNGGAVPHVLIAYVLVLGWLALRGRELSLRTELTDWTER